jgi:hypothetical protein
LRLGLRRLKEEDFLCLAEAEAEAEAAAAAAAAAAASIVCFICTWVVSVAAVETDLDPPIAKLICC